MLCIALHDKVYDKETKRTVTKSNIISSISFRILKRDVHTGIYIFYLGTLKGVTFHELLPMNSTMQDMQCLVEGFGLATLLLKIAQLLSFNIHDTYDMYLATNARDSVKKFYMQRGFELLPSWNRLPRKILDCARMEASEVNVMKPLRIDKPVQEPKPDTTNLLYIVFAEKLTDSVSRIET